MLCNIIIIGVTGVGKSTVGRCVAEKLRKTFIDLDRSIEAHCGVDIQRIFSIEGEEGFRSRESAELIRVANNENNYVLSLGGGSILKVENRNAIVRGSNFIVQLVADIGALVQRLSYSSSKRPIFNDANVKNKVAQIYEDRKSLYDSVTDFEINTSNLQPVQTADIITKEYNKRVAI